MKKNKMMRIAAVLLIVTLLSTCAISGTFAKYVAKADYSDTARVAKWGIKIETSGNLFADQYAAEDDAYITAGGTISVDAADDAAVVAPGTDSSQVENGGFVAKVYGKPEVATRFSLKLGANVTDIFLPFGEGYTDYTQAVKDGVTPKFDFTAPAAVSGLNNSYVTGYAPLKWDLTISRINEQGQVAGNTANLVEIAQEVAGSMDLGDLCDSLVTAEGVSITDAKTIVAQVKRLGLEQQLVEKMEDKFRSLSIRNLNIEIADNGEITLSLDFDPNQNVNYKFEGTWGWAFEQTAPSFIQGASAKQAYVDLCNKCDTYLGNIAAGIIPAAEIPAKASTVVNFDVVAQAVQID